MTDFNDKTRYDHIQRLQKANGIDPYYSRHDDVYERNGNSNALVVVALFGMGAAFGMVGITALKACDRDPDPVIVQLDCQACHSRKAAMVEFFRKAGSQTPEQMAEAVLATKSPRLLAAVAKVESGGNPHIRKGGYKGRHAGAFQVNGRIHGRVSHDPVQQALQAESILSELTETMPIKQALSVYGGDSSSRYQRQVLAELVRVP